MTAPFSLVYVNMGGVKTTRAARSMVELHQGDKTIAIVTTWGKPDDALDALEELVRAANAAIEARNRRQDRDAA